MRVALLGLIVVVGFVAADCGAINQDGLAEQPPALVGPERQLIALNTDPDEGPQQVTLVDPQRRVMSVYHIDRVTGQITLQSVRNVQWDLLMEEYNGVNPLPREIRALVEQR